MSYLVLARKYRPQTFEEVIGQEHVTHTLKNAISAGRVSHANLFSGPRGTGKTTVARILAKAMNCKDGPTPTPCNVCRSCKEITSGGASDVFEIDGASNNSVDQIRELRENVKYMPAHSAHKIYIIDEVHMLSLAAFNALLKTLEEPPDHILFMFATTEPHKIPITILSRCQRHDFRRINLGSISSHMASLCSREHVDITEQGLSLIARQADGSMRDGLSLLDHVISCSEGKITHDHILNMLGVVDSKIIFDISQAILGKKLHDILTILDTLYESGHDMKKFYSDIIAHFRNLLVVKMGQQVEALVDVPAHEIDIMHGQTKDVSYTFLSQILDVLFKEEAAVKYSLQPKLALEMVFIRIFQIRPALSIDTLIKKIDLLRQELGQSGCADEETGCDTPPSPEADDFSDYPDAGAETAGALNEPGESYPTGDISPEPSPAKPSSHPWERVLDTILKNYSSMSAYLNNSELVNQSDTQIEIKLNGNMFNTNMLKRKKNMDILKNVCKDVFGKEMDIVIKTEDAARKTQQQQKKMTDQAKQNALNHPLVSDTIEIFNGTLTDVKVL